MASIRIYGDTNKGCIFFDGSRVEPKFLGTIFAQVKPDETDRLVIQRTDVFRRDGVTFRTLFRRLKSTRVQNEAGENLITYLGFSVEDVARNLGTSYVMISRHYDGVANVLKSDELLKLNKHYFQDSNY